MTTKNTKAAASKKAAELKAARQRPMPESETLPARHQSQGPLRLLDKSEILTITGVSFPTVWGWMRAGAFPRSRVVGGKSMWLSTEIDAWLAALPVRRLKGDKPLEAA